MACAPVRLVIWNGHGMRAEEVLRLVDRHLVIMDVDDAVAERRIEPQRLVVPGVLGRADLRRFTAVAADRHYVIFVGHVKASFCYVEPCPPSPVPSRSGGRFFSGAEFGGSHSFTRFSDAP